MSDNIISALKLVPFWPDDPALWFAQTDAQLWYFNVTDDFMKYNYIIAQLDKHCLTVVKDIVLSPPATNKYETLKTELLKRLKESKVKNVKEILVAQDIGDMKPSQFLHHLKHLAGADVEDDYIKSIWSSRLPSKIQWVSSFLTSSSLEKIAQLADLALNSPSVNDPEDISKHELTTETVLGFGENKELNKRVDDLSNRVETLSLKVNSDPHPQQMYTKTIDRAGQKKYTH